LWELCPYLHMRQVKVFLLKYFGESLVLSILIALVIIHYVLVQKIAPLNFYYILALLACYYQGTEILRQTGIVLKGTIPMILAHHDAYAMVDDKVRRSSRRLNRSNLTS